ncbi:hypothetical protein ZWY2020_039741, partial [Hordeum vulgare]
MIMQLLISGGALANIETIEQFNWCEYVIQCMLAGVMRLKNDIRSGKPVSNLVGCHLWLQIFLLDNLDLGIYNKQHASMPRVKVFDQASIRGMIIMANDIGKPVTSYASAPVRIRQIPRMSKAYLVDSGMPTRQMLGDLTPTTIRLLGPMDFCNYLCSQYPHLASDEITMLLKEIKSHYLSHLATARSHIHLKMMKFADKIIDAHTRTCTCCATRGFAECPPKPTTAMDGTHRYHMNHFFT